MEANLEAQSAPRQIAGEMVMPEPTSSTDSEPPSPGEPDWDRRDTAGAIPLVGSDPVPPPVEPPSLQPGLSEEARRIEEEKQRIAEEWAKLEEERRRAEQQEANRIEAFRIEMQRLEAERAELRRQADQLNQPKPTPSPVADPDPEPDPVAVAAASSPPGTEPPDESRSGMLDLSNLEDETGLPAEEVPAPTPPTRHVPAPEPAMAAAAPGRDRSGLMGAVRSAFKTGARDHEHQFIEAPGGIGIVRYVCEECGYVSISA